MVFKLADNIWLAAVPLCVGFAGWLVGGMDSKPLFCVFYDTTQQQYEAKNIATFSIKFLDLAFDDKYNMIIPLLSP